jgi:hypothetical protein
MSEAAAVVAAADAALVADRGAAAEAPEKAVPMLHSKAAAIPS